MGCDGGTIPRRDELVRVKKKPEQVDKNAETVAKWKHCAITQQALKPPIVACELGKLYNKDAVIEYLLSKDTTCEVASHVKSLAHVKELKLTENNGYELKNAHKGDAYIDVHASPYICPVTGMEMNGKQKFCCLWKCGCVLSERAVKEVKSEVCHKCGLPFNVDDVIILNGTDEEVTVLAEKMEQRRLKAKQEKKRKKADVTSTVTTEEKKPKFDFIKPSTSGIKNGSIKSCETQKSASVTNNKAVAVASASGISAKKLALPQKAKQGYSIAKDPNASATFKSLFTSHDRAKNQTKAHWVTHNPLYY